MADAKRDKAKLDALKDALVDALGLKPVTPAEWKRINKTACILYDKGAEAAEVPVRVARMWTEWDKPFSVEAVWKWWTDFAEEKPRGRQAADRDPRARARRTEYD